MIKRYSSLEEFIEKFFIILTALRTERDHKAAIMYQKVKVHPFPLDSPQSYYSRFLTSYATEYVLKQLSLIDKVKDIKDENGQYSVETSEGVRVVTFTSCKCIFNRSMILPCRHIFTLRRSQHQKFRKATIITAQLASVASEVSNVHFERRLGLLEDLLVQWKEGDVCVSPTHLKWYHSKHARLASNRQICIEVMVT